MRKEYPRPRAVDTPVDIDIDICIGIGIGIGTGVVFWMSIWSFAFSASTSTWQRQNARWDVGDQWRRSLLTVTRVESASTVVGTAPPIGIRLVPDSQLAHHTTVGQLHCLTLTFGTQGLSDGPMRSIIIRVDQSKSVSSEQKAPALARLRLDTALGFVFVAICICICMHFDIDVAVNANANATATATTNATANANTNIRVWPELKTCPYATITLRVAPHNFSLRRPRVAVVRTAS